MSLLSQIPILSILTPFINLMGFIINYTYKFLLLFGIEKVAICIIAFTIIIKVLMIPLTYKQQKFTKVSARMNPEIQALQEKYRGKRDQESMTKMQIEQRAIYKKYGTSPMSGCLPMIVLMLLLFALYPVVYSVPKHVDDVRGHYEKIVYAFDKDNDFDSKIVAESGKEYTFSDALKAFYKANKIYVREEGDFKKKKSLSKDNQISIMSNFSKKNWDDFFNGTTYVTSKGKIKASTDVVAANTDKSIKLEAWNTFAPHVKEVLSRTYYKEGIDVATFKDALKDSKEIVPVNAKNKIVDINTFLTLNIFDTPTLTNITILIPLLAAAFQFLQMQLSMYFNKKNMEKTRKKKNANAPDPMGSMKTMNYIMPIFSGIICLSMPIGVGIYWITSSIVSIILQVIIDIRLQKVEIDEFIEESDEKKDKYLEKQGVHKNNDGKMAKVASMSTKTIADNAKNKDKSNKNNNSLGDGKVPENRRHYSASNISAIANLYNSDYVDEKEEAEEAKADADTSDNSEKGDKE